MKTKYGIIKLILIITVALISGTVSADKIAKTYDVHIKVIDVWQDKDSIRADLEIEIIGNRMAPRGQMLLFPALRLGVQECRFAPVVVNGWIQDKLMKRRKVLSGKNRLNEYASFSSNNGKLLHEKVKYVAAVPAEAWMRDAQVVGVYEYRNCRGEFARVSMEVITDKIRQVEKPARDFEYTTQVPFIKPPLETVKLRSEAGEAMIVYSVGSAEVKYSLGNNYAELGKIQNSIEKIKSVPDTRIKAINIVSYASPEGNWKSNLRLSEDRAKSLLRWTNGSSNLYGIPLSATGHGEDWKRLAELVEKDEVLSKPEQYDILNLIQSVDAFDEIENRIKKLNGGRPYRYLLENLYPQLRRSEYRIEYTIPEFTIEKSREVYETSPEMLSLSEFYTLANEYEPGTGEFIQILTNAAKLFPQEKIAKLNVAAANLVNDNLSVAGEILSGMENDPDAFIYLGILHAKSDEPDKAEEYFNRAQRAGNTHAAACIRQLKEYRTKLKAYEEKLGEWEKYK